MSYVSLTPTVPLFTTVISFYFVHVDPTPRNSIMPSKHWDVKRFKDNNGRVLCGTLDPEGAIEWLADLQCVFRHLNCLKDQWVCIFT